MTPAIVEGVALAESIASREISSLEAVEVYLSRIAATNPPLNAVVTVDAQGARQAARAADEALARGAALGPLHGVPVTVKDVFETKNLRTTAGFPLLEHHVPKADAAVVARLRAAGAIILGKTNTAMLAIGSRTENPLFGKTSHPTHPDRVVGGSSGGSACAVAAGLTALDVGSDSTGSLRIPASFCGVFALKPTIGRLSLAGHIPPLPATLRIDRWLTSPGPIARSAADLAKAFSVLAGQDIRDAETGPSSACRASITWNGRPLRVAYMPAMPGQPVARVVSEAVRRLAQSLMLQGAQVVEAFPEVSLGEQEELLMLFLRFFSNVSEHLFGFSTTSLEGPPLVPANVVELLERRANLITAWERLFERYDVFLCPATPCTAPPDGVFDAPLVIDGVETPYWQIDRHTFIANITGLPALTFPCGRDGSGLPIGAQFLAARGRDEELLAIAAEAALLTG